MYVTQIIETLITSFADSGNHTPIGGRSPPPRAVPFRGFRTAEQQDSTALPSPLGASGSAAAPESPSLREAGAAAAAAAAGERSPTRQRCAVQPWAEAGRPSCAWDSSEAVAAAAAAEICVEGAGPAVVAAAVREALSPEAAEEEGDAAFSSPVSSRRYSPGPRALPRSTGWESLSERATDIMDTFEPSSMQAEAERALQKCGMWSLASRQEEHLIGACVSNKSLLASVPSFRL